MHSSSHAHARRGMTLIELLTVLAIIGLLASILIPTVGKVREKARATTSRASFSQIISAIEQFKNEYGFYPNLNSQARQATPNAYAPNPQFGKINFTGGAFPNTELLFQALTGRNINGERDATWDPRDSGNIKFIKFYTVSEDQFDRTSRRIIDGFGNHDIALFMDVTIPGTTDSAGDGRVIVPDIGVLPRDSSSLANEVKVFDISQVPLNDQRRFVRAGVIMYSAGANLDGEKTSEKMVKSWGP